MKINVEVIELEQWKLFKESARKLYCISTYGNVKSILKSTGDIMLISQRTWPKGYKVVCISGKNYKVHSKNEITLSP